MRDRVTNEEMLRMNTRQQAVKLLKRLSKQGYKYVTRDLESEWLLCFNLKPKRYLDLEIWGYVNEKDDGAMMARGFKNTDITEIRWSNRSPTLINEFLSDEIIMTG
ncbi:hypothetical protein [Candidatus Enterococcus ferrettii]|uniref:Uncharacterized protein n=1 Tax=Candidatus Enterococcus ferrettii TaxID=2815324 RepID=A0ABV0EI15_9ENTE|nr:hypothetical protein [Enterococcus sp. 665A]MBO1341875.1 hypothetical protein [Enterococcus sp. 665A]